MAKQLLRLLSFKKMKPFNLHNILFILIILISFFLRFYQLGDNPPSLDWDEASLGYNAYSILKTGADEYGTKWPLAIRSFNDYKPPLYTYLTIPSVAVFGLNEFSVRFPSALFGFLTVIVTYFLVKELFPKLSTYYSLLATLLLAISPWHLQFSRVAFEANLALFLFILGIWSFLKGTRDGKFLLLSSLIFVASFYAYHSPRLVVPLLLLGLTWYFRKELLAQKRWITLGLILGLLLLWPLLSVLRQGGQSRFTSVTVLTPQGNLDHSISLTEYDLKKGDPLAKIFHNRRIVYFLSSMGGYLDHFNFDFLFLNGDPPARHHAVNVGMLYFWDLPFVLLGMYFLLKRYDKAAFVLFWWFLVAPSASAVTTGTPHAVRALLYLPTYQIFSAYGLYNFLLWSKDKLGIFKAQSVLILTFAFLLLNFLYYLHMYYVHTPVEVSREWQYGYKQAVEEVGKLEKNYKKIIVTYRYDQPYIYFLFYQKIDPAWYQKQAPKGEIERFYRSFGKYEFKNLDDNYFAGLRNTLIVGTPDEIPVDAPGTIKEIKFLDGNVAFRIVGR